ncbi:MAG: FliA/WhiG family RNA polymerase sigma factor [Anaerolineae bacterium]
MTTARAQYATTRDDALLRDHLILENAPLVKHVVDRMAISLPACPEYESLISHGIEGLMQAVDQYDPNRGVPFRTYAIACIQRQVLGTLRRLDLVPRQARQCVREIEGAIVRLRRELKRNPSDEEIAKHLGMSVDGVRKNLQNAACLLLSMDSLLIKYDVKMLTYEEALTPAEHLEEMDVRERLRGALQELTEQELLVLSLYHEQELTMNEIGRVLGMSKSRVSEIYSKAALTLRAIMQQGTRILSET